jgi:hypothetical protein
MDGRSDRLRADNDWPLCRAGMESVEAGFGVLGTLQGQGRGESEEDGWMGMMNTGWVR